MLALPLITVTKRLDGTGSRGGKGRIGRPSGALVASPVVAGGAWGKAWSAWCLAALAFDLALAALLRRRWRRLLGVGAAAVDGNDEVEVEAGEGIASSNSMTSWAVLAFPPLDETVRVADLPVFLTR